jgi:hypothetical protein
MIQKVFKNLLSREGIQLNGENTLFYVVQLQPELLLCNQVWVHRDALNPFLRTVFG